MSHITKIEVEITNLPALKKAIAKLGGTFKENQNLFTYYAGQKGSCIHAATFPNTNYELGITKNPNERHYGLSWDSYGLARVLGQNANKLKQQYAYFCAKDAAMKQGYTPTGTKVLADGRIQLTIAV